MNAWVSESTAVEPLKPEMDRAVSSPETNACSVLSESSLLLAWK